MLGPIYTSRQGECWTNPNTIWNLSSHLTFEGSFVSSYVSGLYLGHARVALTVVIDLRENMVSGSVVFV